MRKIYLLIISFFLIAALVGCDNSSPVDMPDNHESEAIGDTSSDNTDIVSESSEASEPDKNELSTETSNPVGNGDSATETPSSPESNAAEPSEADTIAITVNSDKVFIAKFYDNASAEAIIAQMPLTLDMSDYGAQEKIATLTFDLPSASTEVPSRINIGDIYLYSGNSLVLFYTSFPNVYGYVPVGYVDNVDGLVEALGAGNILVEFDVAGVH